MHIPKTNAQKLKIQRQIDALQNKKKTLLRKKDSYNPVLFYRELNKINNSIEGLEKKL